MSFTAGETCQLSLCLGMSAKGHELTLWRVSVFVRYVPVADVAPSIDLVCFVPEADLRAMS